MNRRIKVALIGNPNTGKSSVFNLLTGLQQKTGNYPGITVEKKEGYCRLTKGVSATIFDLPGTYSLNASSLDENIVIELLMNRKHEDFPDVAVIVADIENIKRNLLLFTQIKDLGIPSILVVNMSDRMRRKGISLDVEKMEEELNTKIVLTSTLKKEGIQTLKNEIANYSQLEHSPCLDFRSIDPDYFASLQKTFPKQSIYKLWLVITQDVNFANIDRNTIQSTDGDHTRSVSFLKRLQQRETIKRYQFINEVLKKCLQINREQATDFQSRLDRVLTHRFWGYVIFFVVLFTIFQAIYDWSSYPMDAIDSAFVSMSEWAKTNLPSWFVPKLIAEGVIPGLGGVAIFIPQIAILFVFISILEETGYMSRVVFLMDRVLRRFGLSGKSVVPLISGTTIDFPTANLSLEDYHLPLFGVYAVTIEMLNGSFGGQKFTGVANLGIRPSFETEAPRLEVFIFDFDGDIYGDTLSVGLVDFIRPEQQFDNLDALKAQIARDVQSAREVLASL